MGHPDDRAADHLWRRSGLLPPVRQTQACAAKGHDRNSPHDQDEQKEPVVLVNSPRVPAVWLIRTRNWGQVRFRSRHAGGGVQRRTVDDD